MNPVAINLADLNGTNGFVVNGIDNGDNSGRSVSNAGDINRDGIDDLIIGALGADESYVVFGGSNVGSEGNLELSALDGTNGFVINDGVDDSDLLGISVSNAGDVNGDGIDDIVIGAQRAGNGAEGQSYVVFGGSNVGSGGSLEVSTLDGTNGFALNGIDNFDNSGGSVSNAGDVNADGIDDLIIGAYFAYGNNNSSYYSGESYVVFGGNDVGSGGNLELSALDGTNGFVINGINSFDYSGRSVSNAGDVNGDGIDDIVIGAPDLNSGSSYVVFGGNDVGSEGSLELSALDGTNGFVINGVDDFDYSGSSVSNAGDVNGDGIDDLVIGAPYAGNGAEGQSYVVFGGSNVGNEGSLELSALDGNNGFAINGINSFANLGRSVSNAGDVNGDGIDDLVVGAPDAESNGIYSSGSSYVIYGSNNLGSNGSLELSALNGNNGFVINGINSFDYSGRSVSNAVDINGDGIDDIVIGAPNADPNGNNSAGESYVIFGGRDILSNFNNGGDGNDSIEGSLNPDNIFALAGNDTVRGLLGDDTINGGDGNDSLFGNNGNDSLFGDNGNDTLWGQADNDTVEGGSGNDRILGNNGNDNLNGGNGADTLFGGANNDLLVGGYGNDLIFGQNGDDNLSGGNGLDTLWGGAGSDTFNISRGGNTDRIKDYVDGEDKFALGSNLTFEDLTFVQNGSTAQIRLTQAGFNEFIAAVENTDVADLDATDFV